MHIIFSLVISRTDRYTICDRCYCVMADAMSSYLNTTILRVANVVSSPSTSFTVNTGSSAIVSKSKGSQFFSTTKPFEDAAVSFEQPRRTNATSVRSLNAVSFGMMTNLSNSTQPLDRCKDGEYLWLHGQTWLTDSTTQCTGMDFAKREREKSEIEINVPSHTRLYSIKVRLFMTLQVFFILSQIFFRQKFVSIITCSQPYHMFYIYIFMLAFAIIMMFVHKSCSVSYRCRNT